MKKLLYSECIFLMFSKNSSTQTMHSLHVQTASQREFGHVKSDTDVQPSIFFN